MKEERYVLEAGESEMSYGFKSEGMRGRIQKLITLSPLDQPWTYNLAFGDWNQLLGDLDDCVRSGNGDADKVLATVVDAVLHFTSKRPGAIIFAQGSTPARTRLYQMGISKHWEEVRTMFEVYGYADDQWIPFERGRRFEAFLARRVLGEGDPSPAHHRAGYHAFRTKRHPRWHSRYHAFLPAPHQRHRQVPGPPPSPFFPHTSCPYPTHPLSLPKRPIL